MNKPYTLLVLIAILSSTFSAYAQRNYRGTDLSRQDRVPLYDCSIFWSAGDRADCQELQTRRNSSWDNNFAVRCSEFRRNKRDICLDLANNITFNEAAFNCSVHNYNRQAKRDCMITKRAYGRGEFNMNRDYEYDRYFDRDYDSFTTTTVRTTPISTTTAITTCGPSYYDSSYEEWRQATRKQRRRGNVRTAVGIGGMVLGTILGGSGNRTTRAVGDVLVVGGAVMTTLGLIDLAETNFTMPHLIRDCETSYIRETKYVTVDERRCTSTRYTEHGYGSSRSYYEVNCSNKRYVTYKRFDAWESSTQYVY